MTVIAHYLFEGFGSNLSFYILGNSALILWAGYYVRKVYFLETDNIAKLWSVLAWLVLPAWLYFAVAGSHYEAGPGIVLFNSKFYITYWASICAFIVGTFFPLVSICVKQRKFIMLGVAVLLAAVFGLIMVAAFS
jgi:predicted membrane channel-forming protein YqfA (hemolysin III family)